MKNLQYIFCRKPVCMGLLFSICALTATAQQVSPPTSNIPYAPTTFPVSYFYPGLADLTNPSGQYNYVRTIVPDQPVQSLTGSFRKRQATDYFDGLGRPLQTVVRKGHADGNDIITTHVYDNLGRETYQYLPYAAPTGGINAFGYGPGAIKLNVSTQMRGFYDEAGSDEPPFSKTVFESSTLNRVVKQMAPGKAWVTSERGVTYDYKTNNVWVYNFGIARNIGNAYPIWGISDAANAIPQIQGYYGAGALSITIVTDEDGKTSREVKDKAGRVVMKMQLYTSVTSNLHPTDFAYTFYVYDALGRLRCVMPPEASKPKRSTSGNDNGWGISWPNLTQQQMDGLCYQYFYDGRSRLVEKKIPGKEVEYYVYDKRDRQVFYQDGNLRALDKWAFTLYDALDRPTMTGTAEGGGATRQTVVSSMANYFPTSTTDAWYYVQNNLYHAYPAGSLSGCKILSYTYYDDYTQGDLSNFPFDAGQFAGITLPTDNTVVTPPAEASQMSRGLPTGSKVRIMDPDDPNGDNWLTSVNYYDDKGRVIQTQSQNFKGGLDISSNLYFFQGQLYKNIAKHSNPHAKPMPGATDGAITEFRLENTFQRNFSSGGGNDMVWSHKQKIIKTAGGVTTAGLDYELAYYDYDHLGRNVLKQFTAGLNLNEYNMRGFLNHTAFRNYDMDTVFQEKLFYDNGFKSKLYNGNIAGIIWRGKDHVEKAYGYSYDNLNRLTHAEFRQQVGSVTPNWSNSYYDYTASAITYDLNGNIKTMNQMVTPFIGSTGKIAMDQLTYDYAPNSNQLIKVEDGVPTANTAAHGLPDFKNGVNTAEEYHYDENGNLVTDDNKAISSITYNYLNKPEVIEVTNKGTITYVYDAAGNRLRKTVRTIGLNAPADEIWDYTGNFVYKDDALQYILNEEGRARPVVFTNDDFQDIPVNEGQTKFVYDYFVKDHLGNVRSTVTATPQAHQYAARHEVVSANVEELVFDHIPEVRDVKIGSIDPDDKYAARLNGEDASKSIGTAIMLRVNPGDRLQFSVNAFYSGDYQQIDEAPAASMVESLFGVLMGGTNGGAPLAEMPDNAKVVQQIMGNPALAEQLQALTDAGNNLSAPKAHLNYLWFNDRLELDISHSGSLQVQQNNTNGGQWTMIEPSMPWNGPANGFLLIYIDNQSIGKDVWFDNLVIQHFNSDVVEEDHYYPFGLTLNTTPNTLPQGQPYKLTTKELESNFDLNMYDFGARMQDMQLGRWWQVDPLAEEDYSVSPYAFCGNNPVLYNDPDGRKITVATKKEGEKEIITITLTGKVINESSKNYTPEQMKEYTDRLASSIASSFSGKDGDVTWNTVVDLSVATEEDQISETDHAFRILDRQDVPNTEGKLVGIAYGSTLPGGKDIYLSADILDNKPATEGPYAGSGKSSTGGGTLEHTGPHEFGHTAGEDHPARGTMDRNIMHNSAQPNVGQKTTKNQILNIRKAYKEGRLNLDYVKPVFKKVKG